MGEWLRRVLADIEEEGEREEARLLLDLAGELGRWAKRHQVEKPNHAAMLLGHATPLRAAGSRALRRADTLALERHRRKETSDG